MSETLNYENQAADGLSIAAIVPNGLALQSAAASVFNTTIGAASGAIPLPALGTTYFLTKAGVAAMTLAAPTAGTPQAGQAGGQDGLVVRVISTTAYAHTITATGLLQTGSASVNVATFAAYAGASVTLMAYNGKWITIAATGTTFS